MSEQPEVFEVPLREDRQKQIEGLEIGESVANARYIDLTFGVDPDALKKHIKRTRGVMDTQTHRVRKKHPTREYQVSNGAFVTTAGNMMIVATCTRIG